MPVGLGEVVYNHCGEVLVKFFSLLEIADSNEMKLM